MPILGLCDDSRRTDQFGRSILLSWIHMKSLRITCEYAGAQIKSAFFCLIGIRRKDRQVINPLPVGYRALSNAPGLALLLSSHLRTDSLQSQSSFSDRVCEIHYISLHYVTYSLVLVYTKSIFTRSRQYVHLVPADVREIPPSEEGIAGNINNPKPATVLSNLCFVFDNYSRNLLMEESQWSMIRCR
jgi:hypothetical protein